MKAWFVRIQDGIDGNWLIHAETASKAKSTAQQYTDISDFDPEYTDLRALRCPTLDDKPFTIENAETVLWFPDAIDEDGEPYTGEYGTRDQYQNQCPCEICRNAIVGEKQ